MKPAPRLRLDVVGLALVAAAASWVAALSTRPTTTPSAAIQLAQDYAAPIGEYDGPVGGPSMYGQDVGNAPIGGPSMYGQDVGNAPIGGPSMYGGDVGNAPIGGPSMYGAPVDQGSEDQPIGGEPLY